MEIKIIKEKILIDEVKKMAREQFGSMVKAAVDIEKEIMAVGGELHSDADELLIEKEGSNPQNVWGINIYPERDKKDWIVFDSLINIKPLANNRTLYVESEEIRNKIKKIVNKLIE